jgi:hypothetical protein
VTRAAVLGGGSRLSAALLPGDEAPPRSQRRA